MKSLSIHIFLVICFLTACMTMPKAIRKVINSPEATNEVLKLHPCKPITDTIISHVDTTISFDTTITYRDDNTPNVGFFIKHDTLPQITKKITIHKTDSIPYLDQRRIDFFNNVIKIETDSLSKQNKVIVQLTQTIDDKSAENKAKDKWLYLFIGLFVIDCLYIAFKLFVK